MDNFLNVQEGLSWAISNPIPVMGIKLDLEKAYDSVLWPFIFGVLDWLKFPPIFTGWIRGCLIGAKSALFINGELTKDFTLKRSIRQGCPISPMLFSLITQVLCVMFDRCLEHDEVKGVMIPGMLEQLCLQLFVDDSLLIIQATRESWSNAMSTFTSFCDLMGGKVNVSKSKVIWASDSPRPDWALEIPWGWVLPGQVCLHLGLPLGVRVSRPRVWRWLKEKLVVKLSKRATNSLSLSGRIIIANFCFSGAINYFGPIAAPSLSNLDNNELTKLIRVFCRTSKLDPPWNLLARSKKEGGLGLVNPAIRIVTLRVKLLLQLFSGKQVWHGLWRHYLGEASTNSAHVKSWNWWSKLWSLDPIKIKRSSLLSPFLEAWGFVKEYFSLDWDHSIAPVIVAHSPLWGTPLAPPLDCHHSLLRKVAAGLARKNLVFFSDVVEIREGRRGGQVLSSLTGLQSLYMRRILKFWDDLPTSFTSSNLAWRGLGSIAQGWKVGDTSLDRCKPKLLYEKLESSIRNPCVWNERWGRLDEGKLWEKRFKLARELPTHPKFGLFLWRLFTHSLPLGERMAWGDDSMRECQVCGLERETHLHFLVGCRVALDSVSSLAESIRMPWLGGSGIED